MPLVRICSAYTAPSVRPRESGDPEPHTPHAALDSRFRGNERGIELGSNGTSTGARIVEDNFILLADDAPAPDGGAVIVSAARLLANGALAQRTGATGVLWPNNRAVSELAPYLDQLALVALVFPSFRDGRAYSQARLLRERHGFRGELRATGQILRDQFLFLHRVGFDAFEVTKPADASAFASALARFSVFYQPAGDGIAIRRRICASRPAPDVTISTVATPTASGSGSTNARAS
jgi:uncharacterized protein (DUF934 family)